MANGNSLKIHNLWDEWKHLFSESAQMALNKEQEGVKVLIQDPEGDREEKWVNEDPLINTIFLSIRVSEDTPLQIEKAVRILAAQVNELAALSLVKGSIAKLSKLDLVKLKDNLLLPWGNTPEEHETEKDGAAVFCFPIIKDLAQNREIVDSITEITETKEGGIGPTLEELEHNGSGI